MAVLDVTSLSISKFQIGIQITKTTDTVADWSSVANDTYFYDKEDELIHYKDLAGSVLKLYSSSGISGTTNYISKFTSSSALGDSLIQDDGTTAGIGVNDAGFLFTVSSNLVNNAFRATSSLIGGSGTVAGTFQSLGNGTGPNIGISATAANNTNYNVAGHFIASTTSPFALWLQDGTEGVGKVLTSMTADGKAQWVALSAAAGIIYIINKTTGVITYYTTLELASAGAVSGDTIYVNPGTYTVTTTATNGLFKDGVNWMFAPKAAVSKSTAGDMFNDTGATLGGSIYGNGVFTTSGSAGLVFNNVVASLLLLYTIEAHSATSSSNSVFKTSGASFNFKVPYCTSTAGFCMSMAQSNLGAVSINVDCIKWRSTANSVFGYTWWYTTLLNVRGNVLESTVGAAINSINSNNRIVLDVNEIIGVTYGINQADGGNVFMSLNCSYITGIYCVGSKVNLNGFCGNININGSGSSLVGGECEYITVNGGYVKTLQVYLVDNAPLVTVTGGTLDIEFSRLAYGITFNVTGGIMNILSSVTAGQMSDFSGRVINGGEVNVYSKFIHGGSPDYPSFDIFTLQAGTLRLLAPIQNNFNVGSSNYSAHGVVWSGGKLIVDRCAINIADTVALPIQATTAGLNLKVLSGGLSTNITANGGVLPGKKMKYKFTISAIAATGINILIPLSYNISESNTGVYNTKALLAQRMAALINGSPFLNVAVIATQDTPGTDEYFYIETLTSGPVFSYNTAVNFSAINIQRWNSYAITNITGGSILENSNVE